MTDPIDELLGGFEDLRRGVKREVLDLRDHLLKVTAERDELRRTLTSVLASLQGRSERAEAVAPPAMHLVEPVTPAAPTVPAYAPRLGFGKVEDRRAFILQLIEQHGPLWPKAIHTLPGLASYARGTIHNDLAALAQDGRIEATDLGWRIRIAEAVDEPDQELVGA